MTDPTASPPTAPGVLAATRRADGRRKAITITILAFTLGALHHDWWFWTDTTLVWGFMPIGLLYHAGYSVAAASLWALVVFWAWPYDVEEEATLPADPTAEGIGDGNAVGQSAASLGSQATSNGGTN